MVFLTEMKRILHLDYVGVNCKRKKWGKKMEIMTILNFHFDYLKPSLKNILHICMILANKILHTEVLCFIIFL